MKKSRAGMTLVEVLIASAILVTVVGIAMSALFTGTRTAASGQLMSQLEQRGNRTLAFFRDQMSAAAFTNASYPCLGMVSTSKQTAMGYQLCGQSSVDILGNKTITFGYVDPTIPVDPVTQPVDARLGCFIRFEADTVYLESSSSTVPTQTANWALPYPATPPTMPVYPVLPAGPSADPSQLTIKVLNLDVNGNGNRNDTFVSGRLMKYVVNLAATPMVVLGHERLDDQVLLRVTGSGAGAFTGDIMDGEPAAWLFVFTNPSGAPDTTLTGASASGLLVNLWHGCLDENGKRFILRNHRMLIHLRTESR